VNANAIAASKKAHAEDDKSKSPDATQAHQSGNFVSKPKLYDAGKDSGFPGRKVTVPGSDSKFSPAKGENASTADHHAQAAGYHAQQAAKLRAAGGRNAEADAHVKAAKAHIEASSVFHIPGKEGRTAHDAAIEATKKTRFFN
jgi:hypothetical protein